MNRYRGYDEAFQDFDVGSMFAPGYQVDLFLPAILDTMDSWGNTLSVVGRLGRGASLVAAQAELDAINSRLGEERPELEEGGFAAFLSPLHEHVSKRTTTVDLRPLLRRH